MNQANQCWIYSNDRSSCFGYCQKVEMYKVEVEEKETFPWNNWCNNYYVISSTNVVLTSTICSTFTVYTSAERYDITFDQAQGCGRPMCWL